MNVAMAQSLSFFGNRRGSTKSHTYQVNGGQQITKDRVDEVKNPRTTAQMVHRCCLHTLSDAHAYLRPFIGGLWEGARSPQAALAAFRKANYPILRAAAESGDNNFSWSKYRVFFKPAGLYQISNGSCGGFKLIFSWTAFTTTYITLSLNGSRLTNDNYYRALERCGFRIGDKVSIFGLISRNSDGVVFPFVISFRIGDAPDVVLSQLEPGNYIKDVRFFCEVGRNLSMVKSGFVRFSFDIDYAVFSQNFRYHAIVIERKVGGKTTFSRSYFKRSSSAVLSPSFAEAIATYPQGGGNVLDGGAI